MKTAIDRNSIIQITIGILSVALLILLAVRYPSLPARVPIQIGLDGEPSNWADKRVFAPVFAAGVAVFNGYLVWLRRQKQPIPIIALILFVVAGSLFAAVTLFA